MAGPQSQQWTNWAGNQTCRPAQYIAPCDIDELQRCIEQAASSGVQVRVVGGGHSFTPLVCTSGIMIDLAGMSGGVEVDSARSTAQIPAGMIIHDVATALWDQGFSLHNQGDIDVQAIAGALSTATHGSGLAQQAFPGSFRAAEYVAADGSLQRVGEADQAADAFRTSLGVLGVFTNVELHVSAAYALRERIEYWSLDQVVEQWHDEMACRRHFSFFWGPQDRSLALYGLGDPDGSSLDCYVKIYDQLAADAPVNTSRGQRVGPAHTIYPMQFDDGWHEFEYFVPFADALDAMQAVRGVMAVHPDQPFPMEVRAIAADTAWISPMSDRDSVSISVSGVAGTDYWQYLRNVDTVLRPFGARAHWGKLHFMDPQRLAEVYPRYADFVSLRRSVDPDGMFLNDHLAALVA